MLAVISPAKKLNFDPVEGVADSAPIFQDRANELASLAKKLSVAKLRDMMKISEDLAKLNKERFMAFSDAPDPRSTKQAGFAFAGDTYQGLQIESFDKRDLAYAQDHLRILSGLYGVLRPLDRIQPYRLEMGRRIKTKAGETLYDFWGSQIGTELDAKANGVIVNLASAEYFKSTGKGLTSQVITPAFKEEREGGLKMIGFFAKKARGMMARYMVKNRIDQIEGLKGFDEEGYGFRADLSDDTQLVFTRKS
ncbi:MAG: peroxide stress protein YaaA [Pseudomonadota bacterium]